MRMRTLAAAMALSVVSAAAYAQDVKVDFDKDANFAAIKTFAVKVGTSWNNPLSEKRVVGEIEQTLTEKGWAKAENPDALVVLHGATENGAAKNEAAKNGAITPESRPKRARP